MLAAAPNPTLIAAGGLTRSYSFLYRGGYDDYLIVRPPGSTGEGDFLLGGGRSFAPGGEEGVLENKRLSEEVREYLRGAVRGYFGGEKGGGDEEGKGVKSEWTGIMGFTEDRFPVVGEAETGLWVCAGFNGHGASEILLLPTPLFNPTLASKCLLFVFRPLYRLESSLKLQVNTNRLTLSL